MKAFVYMIVGSIIGTVFYSCAMGGKPIDFRKMPIRSAEFTAFMKCEDGDTANVCKKECTKYKRDNTCKEGHDRTVRLKISTALDQGYLVISKNLFIKLLSRK